MDDFGGKNYVNALMRYSYFDKQVGYFIIMRKVSRKKKIKMVSGTSCFIH